MKVTAYKTKKVVVGDKLFAVLDQYLPKLHEKDIVVISSKIVSLTQGRVIKNDGKISKEELVKKEADLIMPEKYVRFSHPRWHPSRPAPRPRPFLTRYFLRFS